jgi:hypothetical protein
MDSDTPRPTARPGPFPRTERLDPIPPAPDMNAPEAAPPVEGIQNALRSLSEIREYIAYFITAKIDGLKVSLRRIGIFAALGGIGLVAGAAAIVTATVLVIVGLAQAIGLLLGGNFWAGNLIVGLLLLGLIGAGAYLAVSRLFKASRKATVKKYELRRQRQRADFGHDVIDRARESG